MHLGLWDGTRESPSRLAGWKVEGTDLGKRCKAHLETRWESLVKQRAGDSFQEPGNQEPQPRNFFHQHRAGLEGRGGGGDTALALCSRKADSLAQGMARTGATLASRLLLAEGLTKQSWGVRDSLGADDLAPGRCQLRHMCHLTVSSQHTGVITSNLWTRETEDCGSWGAHRKKQSRDWTPKPRLLCLTCVPSWTTAGQLC